MALLRETHVFLGMEAVVCSHAMRRLMKLVERFAAVEATVLITGESGCGKELVARALHHHSPRVAQPWVDVSCAALPEHLVESELFGRERGAYSSADSAKPGLFEMAHKGTLFLDEVGELEPRMQVKLLRVLDGTPYYRLGGTRKVSVDVRVVAATNQNLALLVEQGAFREDLYHRLTQLQIDVPPLRERVEDVLPLAEHFLAEHELDREVAEDAARVLERYSWPGNIRELRNVITRAGVIAKEPAICASDLPEHIRNERVPAGSVRRNGSGDLSLENMERRMIMEVLEKTGGHQQRAANLLGISRRTLSRKLKLYATEAAEEHAAVR